MAKEKKYWQKNTLHFLQRRETEHVETRRVDLSSSTSSTPTARKEQEKLRVLLQFNGSDRSFVAARSLHKESP